MLEMSVRLVKGLYEPYQAFSSAFMNNQTFNVIRMCTYTAKVLPCKLGADVYSTTICQTACHTYPHTNDSI